MIPAFLRELRDLWREQRRAHVLRATGARAWPPIVGRDLRPIADAVDPDHAMPVADLRRALACCMADNVRAGRPMFAPPVRLPLVGDRVRLSAFGLSPQRWWRVTERRMRWDSYATEFTITVATDGAPRAFPVSAVLEVRT